MGSLLFSSCPFLLEERRMEKDSKIQINKVTPRYYAQECPVCHGFGTLRHGTKVCQGCDGKGYIILPTGIDGGKYGGNKK